MHTKEALLLACALLCPYVPVAKLLHCAMKTSQGGREETTLRSCKCHKSLHILGGWWPWPSAICYCMSVLEDGGGLLGHRHSALTQLGPNL